MFPPRMEIILIVCIIFIKYQYSYHKYVLGDYA